MTPLAVAVCLALASVTLAVAGRRQRAIGAARRAADAAPCRHRLGARTRASLLAQVRLAPLALLLLVGRALVQLAFWRFEPAPGRRSAWARAARAGSRPWARSASCWSWRAVARASRATRRVRRHWREAATPIDDSGLARAAPTGRRRLPGRGGGGRVAARAVRVAATWPTPARRARLPSWPPTNAPTCAARDNLTRAAFAATPLRRSGGRPARASLGGRGRRGRRPDGPPGGDGVTLAPALIKVARLAVPVEPAAGAGQRAHRRRHLESRVRRLLEPPPPASARAAWWVSLARRGRGWSRPRRRCLRQVYHAAEFLVAFGR